MRFHLIFRSEANLRPFNTHVHYSTPRPLVVFLILSNNFPMIFKILLADDSSEILFIELLPVHNFISFQLLISILSPLRLFLLLIFSFITYSSFLFFIYSVFCPALTFLFRTIFFRRSYISWYCPFYWCFPCLLPLFISPFPSSFHSFSSLLAFVHRWSLKSFLLYSPFFPLHIFPGRLLFVNTFCTLPIFICNMSFLSSCLLLPLLPPWFSFLFNMFFFVSLKIFT